MRKNNKEDQWHEEIFIGVIFAIMGVMFLFDCYSKLASRFIHDGNIEGGSTKQKGIIALLTTLENSWWTYILVAVLFLLAFAKIREGIKKYKSK